MNASKTFVVVHDDNSRIGNECFRLHAAGCKDIATEIRRCGESGRSWDVQADSPEAAVASEVAGFQADEMGYTASDFRVCNCCKKK